MDDSGRRPMHGRCGGQRQDLALGGSRLNHLFVQSLSKDQWFDKLTPNGESRGWVDKLTPNGIGDADHWTDV